jgi:hypothetical protein
LKKRTSTDPTAPRRVLPQSLDPRLLTLASIAISLLSVYFTGRVFWLAQRPVVGIIEHNFRTEGSPPTAFFWTVTLKNVGTQPTWVTVKENRMTVTRDGIAVDLPLLDQPNGGIYLMPTQTADLRGWLSDAGGHARVAEVLDGRTRLTIGIRLEYSSPGAIFSRQFNYWSQIALQTAPQPPRFVMVNGGGS